MTLLMRLTPWMGGREGASAADFTLSASPLDPPTPTPAPFELLPPSSTATAAAAAAELVVDGLPA